MNAVDKSPMQILRALGEVLRDQDADPDDLIQAFGDVEAKRVEIAALILSLLQRAPK